MKILDISVKGNAVTLYLGSPNIKFWDGPKWGKKFKYVSLAKPVYDNYVYTKKTIYIKFNFKVISYDQFTNIPSKKELFKRKYPILKICFNNFEKNIYMGDNLNNITNELIFEQIDGN